MTQDQAPPAPVAQAPRITVADLLDRIDAFIARTDGMSETRLGREANGERGLVKSIRDGRIPSLVLTNRILDLIDEHDAANSGQGGEPSGKIAGAAITQPATAIGEAA